MIVLPSDPTPTQMSEDLLPDIVLSRPCSCTRPPLLFLSVRNLICLKSERMLSKCLDPLNSSDLSVSSSTIPTDRPS